MRTKAIRVETPVSTYYAKPSAPTVAEPSVAFQVAHPYFRNLAYEAIQVLLLDSKNRFLKAAFLSTGTVNAADVPLRRLAFLILKYNAANFVLVHNHPSGVTEPSKEDIEVTETCKEFGKKLDADLLDHIIVGPSKEHSYTSLRESGHWN